MAVFEKAFIPAVNEEDLSHLTFLGVNRKVEITQDKHLHTTNFVFEVMGEVKGTSEKVLISVGTIYTYNNFVGKILKAMGFVEPDKQCFINEDGFYQFEDDNIEARIDTFLILNQGNVFLAKIYNETQEMLKHSWQIDVTTLKPF
ncbi:MAG: hypothetical protein MET45_11305 [Nostoc sp. LLA-1]|nr:hypothetical protein [Cyanocohniella sp. LLY]